MNIKYHNLDIRYSQQDDQGFWFSNHNESPYKVPFIIPPYLSIEPDINFECPICLDSNDKLRLVVLPDCRHYFHYQCIEDALYTQLTHNLKYACAYCRSDVATF